MAVPQEVSATACASIVVVDVRAAYRLVDRPGCVRREVDVVHDPHRTIRATASDVLAGGICAQHQQQHTRSTFPSAAPQRLGGFVLVRP